MNQANLWFGRQLPSSDAAMRLFCLPYAGSSASIYRLWSQAISSDIHVCPIELPGHGSRLREPLVRSMTDLIDALSEALLPFLECPYALLGHSMGASIAFRIALSLAGSSSRSPSRVFVMGCRPPHLVSQRPELHRLNDPDLIAAIRVLGGSPDAVLNHPEMMQLLLPILRADFELFETAPSDSLPPLTCGLSAFAADQDPQARLEEMEQWRRYAGSDFRLRSYPGNHFFPWNSLEAIIDAIETDLGF